MQFWPAPHTLPQLPQLFTSVWSEVSHPLLATMSQLPYPLLHAVILQRPVAHVAPVAFGGLHTAPQLPQFFISVCVSMQIALQDSFVPQLQMPPGQLRTNT